MQELTKQLANINYKGKYMAMFRIVQVALMDEAIFKYQSHIINHKIGFP
jgi:hypothetical protein